MLKKDYSKISPEIYSLASKCVEEGVIDKDLYTKHKVNRGLRDLKGNGVLTGLTEISEVHAKEIVNGESVPCKGELYYRGYNIRDITRGVTADRKFGFEEATYLLLFGELPSSDELKAFCEILSSSRTLPNSFVRDIIMKAPSDDIMNSLARSVLTLYSYDNNANDTSIPNVLRQCLQLIALFPQLAIYGYHAYSYYIKEHNSFFFHNPDPSLSTAENILYMLRLDMKYSPLEAKILDLALIIHAEHGGGNNSAFTTHVVTSSGTDTYSAIAAALGSLKGPKHGGANLKVCGMFNDIKKNVSDWNDDEEIENYLSKIINKEAYDKSGLIYGIGHAIYSISDPRAEIFKSFVEKLSYEKDMHSEYHLYSAVERIAPKIISKNRTMYKGISANVDFYSGFVYQMLGIPEELFTPMFAIARISGWSAHRIEELINGNKIIRPAYKAVQEHREYLPIEGRK
ncbi:MAG: citrate/2-methylcitrate synthase [Firmicutes bacterium]|nr:citrate/2-methylcitrate synthase [Bacillota bacterium]